MSTGINEKGLESPTVRHMTGTGGLAARHVGVTSRLAPVSRFG
jgi:hypothetical protein